MPYVPAHPDYLSYRVKRLYFLQSQMIDQALKPYGLGRTQWQVLVRVHRGGPLSQKDLQHMMCVESATLTAIIDALVTKGWLERSEDATDKRVRVVSMTPSGVQRFKDVPDPIDIVEHRMLAGIGADERAAAVDVLERMLSNLEDRS